MKHKKSFHFDFTFCTKLPSEKFSWNSITQTVKFSLNKFIHCDYAMLRELLYYFVFFRSSQISVFHFSRIVYVCIRLKHGNGNLKRKRKVLFNSITFLYFHLNIFLLKRNNNINKFIYKFFHAIMPCRRNNCECGSEFSFPAISIVIIYFTFLIPINTF